MIFIDDFEEDIDYLILQRGRSYFYEGAISELNIENGKVNAIVSGTDDYEVSMTIDEKGNILTSYCDCPYDWGEFCKHEVAVMYAIREYFQNNIKSNEVCDLKELLLKQSKEALAEILYDIANKNYKLKEKLIIKFSEYSDSLEDCRMMIWRYINAAKENGKLTSENLEDALEGAYKVVSLAEKMSEDDYIEAAKRYIEIIDIITGLEVFYIEYYWDGREDYTYSAGFYNEDEGMCPDEITDLVYYITEKLGELAEHDKDNALFNILNEKMNSDIYSCYYDACVWFCGKTENRKFIETLISNIPDKKDALHRRHFLIAHFDGEEAENEFLQNHINMSDFRGIAIRNAMSNKEYERVIELTETAKECFDLHEYDVKGWKKIALGACRELRDVVGMKKYMIQFVVDGEFSYIEQLKEICTNEEWKKILSDIIDKIKKKSQFDYERILVMEKQFDELFSVCQKFKFKILEYYPYFVKNNKEAAQKLFYGEAVREASNLHDRNGYNKLCQKILNFGKAYGKDKSQEIIDVLKVNHKRQRAFIDELMRIEN